MHSLPPHIRCTAMYKWLLMGGGGQGFFDEGGGVIDEGVVDDR